MMFYFSVLCFCGVKAIFTTPSLDHEWEMYRTTFKKNYKSGEELLRRLIWEDNIRYIQQHNLAADRGEYSYWLGMNHMTDLSSKEVEEKMHGRKTSNDSTSGSTFLTPANVVIPDEVDWRKEGFVTPVKNQGDCGSCWAFSATGSLEGQNFKYTGKLVSLSEQNLVDCSTNYGNYGCGGGTVGNAYLYVKEHGIDTEESYPYEADNGTCRFNPSEKGATVTGIVRIKAGDENALRDAVATVGPIAVGINAGRSFQSYKTGLYNDPLCNSANIDHNVLVVGYGVYNGEDYWLVKNSWGTDWGMNGYIMMSRNAGNQCWIASQALYPLV